MTCISQVRRPQAGFFICICGIMQKSGFMHGLQRHPAHADDAIAASDSAGSGAALANYPASDDFCSCTNSMQTTPSAGPAASVVKATINEPVAWNTTPTTSGTMTLPNCQNPASNPLAEPARAAPAASATITASSGL